MDLILLNIMGTMSNCVGRPAKINFERKHLGKFQSMGMLLKGVTSESTLCRFDSKTDLDKMAGILKRIAEKFMEKEKGDELKIINIDGKCTRGTLLENGRCPDIVSAYSVSDGMTVGTEMCEEKSNEIKAVPKLLDKLDLDFSKCVFTADAMSCQKNIVDKIREKGGHFLIEVKGNQKTLKWNLEDNLLNATCPDV